MKKFHIILAILNNEPVDVGILIAYNIKYMDDAPQRTYEHFCVINKLCGLDGVQAQPNDVMVGPIMSINTSAMRQIHLHYKKKHKKEHPNVYRHEINKLK